MPSVPTLPCIFIVRISGNQIAVSEVMDGTISGIDETTIYSGNSPTNATGVLNDLLFKNR